MSEAHLSKNIEDVKLGMGFARSLVFSTDAREEDSQCSVRMMDDENKRFMVLCRPSAHDLRLLSEWARQSAEYMEASE